MDGYYFIGISYMRMIREKGDKLNRWLLHFECYRFVKS